MERLAVPALRRAPSSHPLLAGSGGPSTTLLGLQRRVGNTAVARLCAEGGTTATGARIVQRQPKGGGTPQWLTDAQAEMARMFPKDKAMAKVTIKDYSKLNATLKGAGFGAWTQSKTEIFLRDPSAWIDPQNPASAKWPAMVVRYVLHHEAEHIRDFAKHGGPPATWKQMLEHEKKAYTSDVTWLAGAEAKRLIPDAELRAIFTAQADENAKKVTALLDGVKNVASKQREKTLYDGMIAGGLLPKGAPTNPRDLYIQPP